MFQVQNEFELLTTSIHRLKLDGTKKTTLRFSQKVEKFDQKFPFYNWWRRFLRKVSVYENFEVFCTLHATFQVWAINQQLRKTFFRFFFLLAFFLENERFHSATTSEKVFMRLQCISEMISKSLTTKPKLSGIYLFSNHKQQAWIRN